MTGHQSVGGQGGVIGVTYETHLLPIMEMGDEHPAVTTTKNGLLGWHSEPTPPNQPPIPPDAHWCCTTGTFPREQRAIFGTHRRLRAAR